MLLLCLWKDGFNFPLLCLHAYIMLLLCVYNIITDNEVDKHLFMTAFLHWKNKPKGFHIPPIGVYVSIWVQVITKASSVLGNLCPEAILGKKPNQKPKWRLKKKVRVSINYIAYFHKRWGSLASSFPMLPRVKETRILPRISMPLITLLAA